MPISDPRWRLPQQARSRERFHRILDAAAELFAQKGYESVTTDDIADQAQTSVGGLYRFFPDKLAVFQALVDRYQKQLREQFAQLNTEAGTELPLSDYIHGVMEGFAQFVKDHPSFRSIFLQSRWIGGELYASDMAFNQDIAEQLSIFLRQRHSHLDRDQCELLAAVSVEVASALEMLSLSRDSSFQQQVLEEAKKVLVAYLQPYFP